MNAIRIDPAVDPGRFRQVLGHYPTGVSLVTAVEPGGAPIGLVVGSFTSVSLDPPLVGFLPGRQSTSWPRIAEVGRFCVNILAADQQAVCSRFTSKDGDKFAGLNWRPSQGGSPVIHDVVAWIDCTLHAVHDGGDHHIVLGRVLELDVARPEQPLLFFRGRYGNFAPFENV